MSKMPLGHLVRRMRRVTLRKVYSRLLSWWPLPIPFRLPWGGWWFAWNDVIGKHIRLSDKFEQGEQAFLLRFLEPRMTVLDIGAHHGLYTLLASKKVGSQGHVVAFEPSPRELNRLRWHLRINRCRNVRVEPYALGRKEDLADLYVCTVHETGCNSLRPPNVAEPLSKVQVPVKVLDHYVEGTALKTVDFVKLDVEGGELDVLKGAEKHLCFSCDLLSCANWLTLGQSLGDTAAPRSTISCKVEVIAGFL